MIITVVYFILFYFFYLRLLQHSTALSPIELSFQAIQHLLENSSNNIELC